MDVAGACRCHATGWARRQLDVIGFRRTYIGPQILEPCQDGLGCYA